MAVLKILTKKGEIIEIPVMETVVQVFEWSKSQSHFLLLTNTNNKRISVQKRFVYVIEPDKSEPQARRPSSVDYCSNLQ